MKSPRELARRAEQFVPPAVRRQAKLVNEQIAAGNKMISAVQNMESTAQSITDKIADSVGPILAKLTGSLDELTNTLKTTGRVNMPPEPGLASGPP